MTGARLQIRTEQHGQASALTTAVLPQPRRRPFRTADVERLEATLPACRATPTPSCPSPIAVPASTAAPSSPAGTILLACHQA